MPSSNPPNNALNDSTAILAVLFDYGLVLSGPQDPAAWEHLKQTLSATEADFYAAYWKYRDEYDRGDLNAPTYWAAVAAKLGRTLDEAQLRNLIAADIDLWTVPNQPMIAWAEQLQRSGIKTGLLSNIGDAMEFGVLEHCPWLQDFNCLTFSHRIGYIKPESFAYQIAIESLGILPAEILFIDDKAVNIEAAQQAGMHAVRYTSHEQFLLLMNAQGFTHLLPPQLRSTISEGEAV